MTTKHIDDNEAGEDTPYSGIDRRAIITPQSEKRRTEDLVVDRLARLETTVEELQKDLAMLNADLKAVNDKYNDHNIKMTVNFSQVNETMTVIRLSAETLRQTIDDIKTTMSDIKVKQEHIQTQEAMAKGSWKMLALLGSGLAAAGSFIAYVVEHFKFTP